MSLHTDPEDRRAAGHAPRRRALGPGIAVILGIAVVVGAYGLRYANQSFFAPAPSGPLPVIVPDQSPVKEAPKDRGGMQVPGQDMIILNGEAARPKVEQLLPPPETPLVSPRPQTPQAPPPATEPGQQQAMAPVAEQQTQIAAAPPAPPKPAPTAKPASAPAAPQTGKGWLLQLGAVKSPEAAQAEWTRLKAAQPDLLGSLSANAMRVDLGDKGVFYRVVAGPISDESAATRTCNTLKQRNVACILLRP